MVSVGHQKFTLDSDGQLSQVGVFAEMFINANASATVIAAKDILTQIKGFSAGESNKVTFKAGVSANITNLVDNTGGEILATTDTAHGLSIGDKINISGTTANNGKFTVNTVPSTTTFTFTDTFGLDEAGVVVRGEAFVAQKAGKYRCSFSISYKAEISNKVYHWNISKNGVAEEKSRVAEKSQNVTETVISGQCVLSLAVGDVVKMEITGKTDASNITHEEVNFIIEKL